MSAPDRIWHARRFRAALRWRALVIAGSSLLAANLATWGISGLDSIGSYRVIHVPEAATCGRAVEIGRGEAREILESFAAAAGPMAEPPIIDRASAESESEKGESDARLFAHAHRR